MSSESPPQVLPEQKAAKLWRKAFGTLRAIGRLKLTAVSCATCPVEHIATLFEEKEKYSGNPPKHFLKTFSTDLRHMVPSFLDSVSDEIIRQVCVNLQFCFFEPDEFLMRVGDVPDGWYFVVAGACAVFANDKDATDIEGSSKRLNVIKSGVGFGELGFLTADAKRNASITATAPHGAYILFVPKQDYVDHLIRFMKKNDNIIDTQQFLCTASLLHWLDDRVLIQLAHGCVVRDIDPFDVYKQQGEQLDEVFVVQSGFVKLVQRVGNLSCELAVLSPGDVGGISDLIVSLARGKNEAFCRCTYRTEGQPAKILVMRRYGFEQMVLSTMMPVIESVVKVRLVWEGMLAAGNKQIQLTPFCMFRAGGTRGQGGNGGNLAPARFLRIN